MLNAIAEFFAYIFLELFLEGLGALLRRIYQFLFNRPSTEIKKKKRRRGDPYDYNFSKNKQVALVAIVLLILIIKIV